MKKIEIFFGFLIVMILIVGDYFYEKWDDSIPETSIENLMDPPTVDVDTTETDTIK